MKTKLSFLISLIVVLLHLNSGKISASEKFGPELFLQLGHASLVSSVAFHPNGTQLASGSADNTIKLWEPTTGAVLRTLSGHSDQVQSVAFSPDGTQLASGSRDNTIKLWEPTTGAVLRTLSGHSDKVLSVAFHPNGTQLASGDYDGTIKLWDPTTGQLLHTLSGSSFPVSSVAFHPDGTQLASGDYGGGIKLWDITTGQLLRTLSGRSSLVSSVAFHPDGTQLASGSTGNTVHLWDITTGQLLRTLSGHSDQVQSVAFSPDGTQLASGSADNTIKLWEPTTGAVLRTLSGHSDQVQSVAFHPDGTQLASGSSGNTIKLWEPTTGAILRTLSGHSDKVLSVAFHPNGTQLASGDYDGTIKLWDPTTGQLLHTLSDHSSLVSSVAFHPDGTQLASGSYDKTIKLWDPTTGQLLGTLSDHDNSVLSVAFHPDGTQLASGSYGDTVKLWDPTTGQLLRTLSDHANIKFMNLVGSVAFSPDGTQLASGSYGSIISLWNITTDKVPRGSGGHFHSVASVAFSPDGTQLASGSYDSTIKLWDPTTGQLLRTLSGHSDQVQSVAFSPDGTQLASGSADSTIKLWDTSTGAVLRTLSGHTNSVLSVAFHPDGTQLASGSADSTIKLWESTSGDIMMTMLPLPGNQWLAYHPKKLVYNSSFPCTQKEQYAAIRFQNKTFPAYPLEYYCDELKRPTNLLQAFREPQPDIQPKWIRWRWDRTENKGLWASGILFILFTGIGVGYVLRKRSDPMEVARQFFEQAGFQKVESVTSTLLLLHPKQGQLAGVATLWQEEQKQSEQTDGAAYLSAQVLKNKDNLPQEFKFYVVYTGQGPSTETLQSVRATLGCETIPLVSSLLEQALSATTCEQRLKELEEPYLTRTDPYNESKPINDPNWFYGRDEFLDRLPAVLAQGQHVGIFGLRKVGKTSLINQLRQRFLTTPTVFMDCQAFSANASIYFEEILKQLRVELLTHDITGLPELPRTTDAEEFRQHFLALFDLWTKAGNREPFLLIFDEIDKFFPNQDLHNSEQIIAEYVRFFRVLRGLAQTHSCLVTLVIAYRPDVNRLNLLSPAVGENPMFQSFQEEYLGFLDTKDSADMIREIGLWKQITWDADAAQRVFYHCGGHPLVSRLFASVACERGKRKSIDVAQVEQIAQTIQKTFRKNQIGNYYKEGVWELLQADEQQVLTQLSQNGAEGIPEAEIPRALEEALTNLEHFGLILNHDGRLCISAKLLHNWVQRTVGL